MKDTKLIQFLDSMVPPLFDSMKFVFPQVKGEMGHRESFFGIPQSILLRQNMRIQTSWGDTNWTTAHPIPACISISRRKQQQLHLSCLVDINLMTRWLRFDDFSEMFGLLQISSFEFLLFWGLKCQIFWATRFSIGANEQCDSIRGRCQGCLMTCHALGRVPRFPSESALSSW